jgi:hypothetical protein
LLTVVGEIKEKVNRQLQGAQGDAGLLRQSQWPTPNGQQLFPVFETIVYTIIVVVLNYVIRKRYSAGTIQQ